MLDVSNSDLPTAAVKRYAPPNQRNRSLGRRKSGGGQLERANSYGNDGERIPIGVPKSFPVADHGEAGGNSRANESARPKLIHLHGCSNSEASQLLKNRWSAAMDAYYGLPEDSPDRPVMYTSTKKTPTPTAWGHPILPHQMMQPTGGATVGSNKDFLAELRQAMQNANSHPDTQTGK